MTLNLPTPPLGVFTEAVPVFNLVPAPGEPARFGLEDTKVPIILDTSVRTDGDYGVNVSIKNTTQVAQLLSSRVTLVGRTRQRKPRWLARLGVHPRRGSQRRNVHPTNRTHEHAVSDAPDRVHSERSPRA